MVVGGGGGRRRGGGGSRYEGFYGVAGEQGGLVVWRVRYKTKVTPSYYYHQ